MTWVSVGIAVAGAASSVMGGLSGKAAAEDAGKMQAKIIRQTAAENARRRELELQQKLGQITAGVGASNLQMSGSSSRYRDAFESNYRREMAWDKMKARMDARAARKGAGAAGDAALYSGLGQAAGFAGQAYGSIRSARPASTGKVE